MKTSHNFDLEERTFQFAKNVRLYLRGLTYDFISHEDVKQLIRSSGSIGANYREANDSLGKKDFIMRLKIARKEAKETIFFLRLLIEGNPSESNTSKVYSLLSEATELKKILSAIINKFESKY